MKIILWLALLVHVGAAADESIQGRLVIQEGQAPVLEVRGRAVPLVSSRRSIAATLHDARLSGRELKLIGNAAPNGSLDVRELYVVHPDGTLYRLVYFCSTCNITRFAPGQCDCCQQPTVPTEIPLSDPRVAREK